MHAVVIISVGSSFAYFKVRKRFGKGKVYDADAKVEGARGATTADLADLRDEIVGMLTRIEQASHEASAAHTAGSNRTVLEPISTPGNSVLLIRRLLIPSWNRSRACDV